MIVSTKQLETLRRDFQNGITNAKPQLLRKISQFALDEIVLPPTGPYKNQRFSFDAQPFARLWFELLEAEKFCRYAVVGPPQTGKTFTTLVVPAMFHLFEIGENVVYGIPTMDMAKDKWEQDLLPAIKASKYADLLPDKGTGSKGGKKFESITFKNGATLKFMSAKGGDEKRSGFTSRVLLLTEIDKYDLPKEDGREADPVTQMIERLGAFDTLSTIIYMECTVSVAEGRIWVEYTNGSEGRIVLQCPHCQDWVTLEREHLIGWQEATNEVDARAGAAFACPCCGERWTEEQRFEANHNAKLLHRGQTIDKDGTIHGDLPKTLTAGFRWNAANNLFKYAADAGGREWVGQFSPNETNADKALRQGLWAKPAAETKVDQTPLEIASLMDRTHPEGRGVVPADCELMSVGLDLGGWWCHWVAYAWGRNARGYIVDYGRISVPQASLGLEAGLLEAMREFRELCGRGWNKVGTGELLLPDENLIDSGWKTPIAYQFIQETGLPFRPCKGLSVDGEPVNYTRPKSTGAVVQAIGEGWHIARLKDEEIYLVEVDADEAKSTLHARLSCDIAAPGAITMFSIDRLNREEAEDRRKFLKHLTAEKSITEFIPGRGTVTRWTKIRKDNHHLDASALGLIGGSINGVSVIDAFEDDFEPSQPIAQQAPVRREPEAPVGLVRPVSSGWIRKMR